MESRDLRNAGQKAKALRLKRRELLECVKDRYSADEAAHSQLIDSGEATKAVMRELLIAVLLGSFAVNGHAQTQHRLHVVLQPEQKSLAVVDHITLPTDAVREQIFWLHRNLNPVSSDAEIKIAGEPDEGRLQKYRATLLPGSNQFTLRYRGEIFHPPQQDVREARVFENTQGTISTAGVVLSGNSGWYPVFGDGTVTFSLDVEYPEGWRAISQGKRGTVSATRTGWDESQPQNEIHLIAAPYTEFSRKSSGIESLVYLRREDSGLAQRYQDATERYLAMYQHLIGPYPYAKFALLENFWETGYGMPSFTLLGSQVIRLPFIVNTSYPHEILHNWWGNGVYVDYAKGNWSEGLTAYLADHLLQEQKGAGAEYRRGILQKYADFVTPGRDISLAEFTSRHSEQSEALGYGKGMMLFHMLRRQLGDQTFTRALQNFYRDYRFQRASFADLERTFSESSGQDLKPFFAQWVQQGGMPQLRLVSARSQQNSVGYDLEVVVEQTQSGPAYDLALPIAVTLVGQEAAYVNVIGMQKKRAEIHIQLNAKPLRADVDPEFDLLRRLDQNEKSVAFSQIMGAENLLIVLPRHAPEAMKAQYLKIAQAWQKQPQRATRISWDDEIVKLPDSGGVWLFGWENSLRGSFSDALGVGDAAMKDFGVQVGNREYDRMLHAVALTAPQRNLAWLAAPEAAMLTVLARKLPHYTKFSYVAFAGAELNNLAKGVWPINNSPMAMAVIQQDGHSEIVARGKLPNRDSLAR